jgi:hypothetical protein
VSSGRRWVPALLSVALLLFTGCSPVYEGVDSTWTYFSTTTPAAAPTNAGPPSTAAGRTSTAPRTTGSTGPSTTGSSTGAAPTSTLPLAQQHDRTAAVTMAALSITLTAGKQAPFVAAFTGPLQHRLAHWFANYRAIGVAAATFTPLVAVPGAPDTAQAFTRIVDVGVRTPYDAATSLPAIRYTVTWSAHGSAWQITRFDPTDTDDPMNCDCTLQVRKDAHVAVVSRADQDFGGWPDRALQLADASRTWLVGQLGGSGLKSPNGTVFFLAKEPFRWYLSTEEQPVESNETIPMLDGNRPYAYASVDSRIVLQIGDFDVPGTALPTNSRTLSYLSDVTAHEMTHQVLQYNEPASGDVPTWAAEGIAVAMENLHHDTTDPDEQYPDQNDPAELDPDFLRKALTAPLPTTAQLYQKDPEASAREYAVSGSVFLFVQAVDGTPAMLKVADDTYAFGKAPWSFIPDPKHPDKNLTDAAAQAAWKDWVTRTYLS